MTALNEGNNYSLAEQLRYTACKYVEIKADERCCLWEAAWMLDRQDRLIAHLTGAPFTSSASP